MRVLNISCPGCTATMLIDRMNNRAYCEYCGTVVMLEEDSDTRVQNDTPEIMDLEIFAGGHREDRRGASIEEELHAKMEELRANLKENELRLRDLEELEETIRMEKELLEMESQEDDYEEDYEDYEDEDSESNLSDAEWESIKRMGLYFIVVIIALFIFALLNSFL